MPRVEINEPEYLQEREIRKLLREIKKDKTRFTKRNELIIRILVETGIRLNELTSLDVGHINIKERIIRVRRKGNIEQTLPINPKLNSLLGRFIKGKKPDEPFLISSFGKRITNRRVSILVQGFIQKAGIKKSGISVHSLRHSFCVRLLEKGVNIKVIQILAGHRNISATERYLHVAKSQLRKEVRKIELN
ncbi:MAG: tyrosine-type recombinase/integrase [Candidatus Moranbacteria bacterium]|nr:tyrosine-type recombinase/integrase [Candidatus Moranbacteria bacterium]